MSGESVNGAAGDPSQAWAQVEAEGGTQVALAAPPAGSDGMPAALLNPAPAMHPDSERNRLMGMGSAAEQGQRIGPSPQAPVPQYQAPAPPVPVQQLVPPQHQQQGPPPPPYPHPVHPQYPQAPALQPQPLPPNYQQPVPPAPPPQYPQQHGVLPQAGVPVQAPDPLWQAAVGAPPAAAGPPGAPPQPGPPVDPADAEFWGLLENEGGPPPQSDLQTRGWEEIHEERGKMKAALALLNQDPFAVAAAMKGISVDQLMQEQGLAAPAHTSNAPPAVQPIPELGEDADPSVRVLYQQNRALTDQVNRLQGAVQGSLHEQQRRDSERVQSERDSTRAQGLSDARRHVVARAQSTPSVRNSGIAETLIDNAMFQLEHDMREGAVRTSPEEHVVRLLVGAAQRANLSPTNRARRVAGQRNLGSAAPAPVSAVAVSPMPEQQPGPQEQPFNFEDHDARRNRALAWFIPYLQEQARAGIAV